MDLIVYNESELADVEQLEARLGAYGIGLEVREALPGPEAGEDWYDWLAWMLAWSKVRNPQRPIPPGFEPKGLEIDREKAALQGQGRIPGPLYDGKRLLEAFHGPLPKGERSPAAAPIVVLTDRLMGTFEGSRYHVRFLVTGHPLIVSPPGLIDGPARDREYYVTKQLIGRDATGITQDDHLTKQDPRLQTSIASAILQAVKYADDGQPFCQEQGCRFFNPHWQKDLLATMATEGTCKAHEAWIQAQAGSR